ncbi:uncharacterized protein V6R79_014800 [Siganus canaliculatus]
MAKQLFCPTNRSIGLMFREVSYELLTDFLVNLNQSNKDNLNSLSKCCGTFKNTRVMEHIFLMTKELGLDPFAGYQAVELLHRFMVKHLTELLTAGSPQGAADSSSKSHEDVILENLKDKFLLIVFSCVQIASKLSIHRHMTDNNIAVRFLESVGLSVSKQALLASELMVLKGLEFQLNASNPLTYVETLLEVLGRNEPSVPVEHLHPLCCQVLQFVSLQRSAIFDSLLVITTQCATPSGEQREKFVAVTEDYMLLGVSIIAVAAFIFHVRIWEQVVEELTNITRISRRSICDFAYVILMHVVRDT